MFDGAGSRADRRHQSESLTLVEDGDVADGKRRVVGHRGDDPAQSRTKAAHGRGVEQSGGIADFDVDAGRLPVLVGVFDKGEREVELGGRDIDRRGRCPQTGEIDGDVIAIVHRDRDLEERVDLCRSLWIQFGHKVIEGDLCVVEGVEVGVADLAEYSQERRVLVDVRRQCEGVHEHSDERVEVGVASTGHRCADDDLVGTGIAAQQRGDRGVRDHEEGRVAVGGQRRQRAVTFAGHPHRHDAARDTCAVRARTIKRQFGFCGGIGETPAPEIEVCAVGGGQRGTFGGRDRRVLDGQRLPIGRVTVDACAVGGGEIGRERGE
ncbi:Uncharacterised protein [Mycobacteroides abscessus subsp. abscessus]|nr:Uncharacterised protein [Mycobacteroides abscessus subsp. abscessus]